MAVRSLKLGMAVVVTLPFLAGGAPPPESFDALAAKAEAATGERPAEAASLYAQALALRPGWAEGWLYRGASLLELGRFPEARDALRKGAELEPHKGTPWAYLGMAEFELAEYKQAWLHILKGEAIGLADRPAFVAAVRYRGALIALGSSDFDGALEQLRPLVRAGTRSPEILQALGLSALFIDTPPGNLPAAKRSLVDLAGRAAWAFLSENAAESAPLFQQLLAQYSSEPGVHYMYGVFAIDRDAGAAEAAFREELRLVPGHVLARVQLAQLLSARGETQEAERLAGEAVRLEPSSPLCQVTLGRASLSAGHIAQAIAALEKAERLAPDASRTHFYLQQAYRKAGRVADAQKQQAEFSRLRAQQEPATVGTPP